MPQPSTTTAETDPLKPRRPGMEGGQKTLEEPLRHGDASVHVVHKYLTPYDADEQRFVPFEEMGGRIRCLEWAIVALNVVLYFAMNRLLAWEAHLGGFAAGWIAAMLVDPRSR